MTHARSVHGPREARPQVVRGECLGPSGTPRFAELGVVVRMQPRHCAPEIAGPGKDWAENVGPGRRHNGGDAAAARASGPAWRPAETLDMATAVHGYTRGSAYANFLERERGSVTVGKPADFVALSRDILRVPPEEIPGTGAGRRWSWRAGGETVADRGPRAEVSPYLRVRRDASC
ncbi:amidohydrolase family protein [Streptomyces sp. G44]|uniref:amidohydrolase family protein n=1 Tax=Streptomyces sp. G44 TaxID=2807632 RepID=UPI0027DC0CCC|nr:amidohydrolase family protein [Streptomyces sp. G44]